MTKRSLNGPWLRVRKLLKFAGSTSTGLVAVAATATATAMNQWNSETYSFGLGHDSHETIF